MSIKKNNTYFKENDGKVYYYDENGVKKEVPNSALGTLKDDLESTSAVLIDTIETTSGILQGEIDTASGNLQEQINNIGSPLTYSGTKTVDEINALENIKQGTVYTMSNSGTITAGDIEVEQSDEIAYADGWVKIGKDFLYSDYYKKTETSSSEQLVAAFNTKEDKVFVAEYNVTPYADIKAAYDAGKQIICKYAPLSQFPDQVIIAYLTQYVPMGNCFVFAANNCSNQFQIIECSNVQWSVGNNVYYTKSETSGKQEIADALDLKQNTLTAGTDLVINDGIIGVNTNGIITNSSNKEFVAGDSTYAKGKGAIAVGYETSSIGYGSLAQGWHTLASADIDASVFIMYCVNSHAEGGDTSAMGNCAHAEGIMTLAGTCSHAEGHQTEAKNYSHSEGEYTHALGYHSHAEGRNTYTSSQYSHAEGYGTSALNNYSHTEGYETIAGSESMHVGGTYNKTSSDALFVIGNGTAYNKRNDAFIVSANGTVSATKFVDAEPTLTITGGNYVSVAEDTTNNKLIIDVDSDLGTMLTTLSSILSAGALPTTGRHILGVTNGTLGWLEVNQ